MYWWCLGWWDDCDEFSGVQDNKEHPITKKARLKTPKKNLIVILMHLLKIYKSKQIDERWMTMLIKMIYLGIV